MRTSNGWSSLGFLELDVLVVAAGGLARERNRVQRVARAGAEKVEVLAVG